ncbi:hypothetical protein B9Z55_018444 [Caenorhabditis nigoni]|uniref:Uncharacterized protein n=1 Tax=Caenorhabditis nigoni TaxID=1611254 RepID=A0A2G5TE93_9PELO|nr:hypothetical protein B9Z55_018444 [Caenorhabditis nigoni]
MQGNNGVPDRRMLGFTKMMTLMVTYKNHVPLTLRQYIQVKRMGNELREALDDEARQVSLFMSWMKWAITNYKNVKLHDTEHQETVLRYLAMIETEEATRNVPENLALLKLKLELLFMNDVPELQQKFEEWKTLAERRRGR